MAEEAVKLSILKSILSGMIIKGIPCVQRLVLENQAHLRLQKCQPLEYKKLYTLIIVHTELGGRETKGTKARQMLGTNCRRI